MTDVPPLSNFPASLSVRLWIVAHLVSVFISVLSLTAPYSLIFDCTDAGCRLKMLRH